MQNFYHLDQLIQGYFNQDADIINEGEDSIEGIIALFKQTASDEVLKELAEEVYVFLNSHQDRLEEAFMQRYSFDFSPQLWEMTAHDFLLTVRTMALGQTAAH
ncbi:hypothetical protein I6G37_03520 [Serratia rubidaea]|nr:hypothetical protein I6G37_03520 [Serratia rubidaea]